MTGVLEVGVNDAGEVIVNHPDLQPDENGCGHIVFSGDQARAFADLLYRKADESRHGAPIGLDKVLIDVKRKRQRQVVVHGWSRVHDDTHVEGELARAAIPYIQATVLSELGLTLEELQVFWPWPGDFRFVDNPRENLLNAAALLVAELERLDRLS
jgi:hypothetical protein